MNPRVFLLFWCSNLRLRESLSLRLGMMLTFGYLSEQLGVIARENVSIVHVELFFYEFFSSGS